MLVTVLQRSFLHETAVDCEKGKSQCESDFGFSLTWAIFTKLWPRGQHTRGQKSIKKDYRTYSLPFLNGKARPLSLHAGIGFSSGERKHSYLPLCVAVNIPTFLFA